MTIPEHESGPSPGESDRPDIKKHLDKYQALLAEPAYQPPDISQLVEATPLDEDRAGDFYTRVGRLTDPSTGVGFRFEQSGWRDRLEFDQLAWTDPETGRRIERRQEYNLFPSLTGAAALREKIETRTDSDSCLKAELRTSYQAGQPSGYTEVFSDPREPESAESPKIYRQYNDRRELIGESVSWVNPDNDRRAYWNHHPESSIAA